MVKIALMVVLNTPVLRNIIPVEENGGIRAVTRASSGGVVMVRRRWRWF
jgi:hypothetical protein